MTTPACDKRGISRWCNNQGVKRVQLKTPTVQRTVFNGDIVHMCAECRKANSGGFKIVK